MPEGAQLVQAVCSVLYTDTIPPWLPDNELFREFDKLIPAAVWIMDGSIRLAQQGFEQLCKQLSARLAGIGPDTSDPIATIPEARNRVYARLYEKRPSSGAARRRPRSSRGK